MVSLKQLQKENEKLKKMQSKLNEMRRTNEVRKDLLRENKRISRNIKHGKAIGIGTDISKGISKVGKRAGKDLLKGGKVAFKGLQRYAMFLEQQERKQKSFNRKLKSVKKTKKN